MNRRKYSSVCLILFLDAALASERVFVRLRETCRTETGFGVCIDDESACGAVGGQVASVATTTLPPVQHRIVYSYKTEADLTPERTCTYGKMCCVIPPIVEHDCSVCGLKGNGERGRETTPAPTHYRPPAAPGAKMQQRIMGGTTTQPNEWCWQAALVNQEGLIGSGALVAENYVLTAAHLVAGLYLEDFLVALGEWSFVEDSGGERRKVFYAQPLAVELHPEYNPATGEHNLALIRIPHAPCNEENVCTVCLPDDGLSFRRRPSHYRHLRRVDPRHSLDGIRATIGLVRPAYVEPPPPRKNPYRHTVCFLTGWGDTGYSAIAPELQELSMRIMTPERCRNEFSLFGVANAPVSGTSFCAMHWQRRHAGTCVLDGGSPLVCQGEYDQWRIVGVVSMGTTDCKPSFAQPPTIFSDVGAVRTWIDALIAQPPQPLALIGRSSVGRCGSALPRPCPTSDNKLYPD